MERGSWKLSYVFGLQRCLGGSSPAWDKYRGAGGEISRTSSAAPQGFLVPSRVGSDPRAGGKTSFLPFFEPKNRASIIQKHPQPGEMSLRVRGQAGAGAGGVILLPPTPGSMDQCDQPQRHHKHTLISYPVHYHQLTSWRSVFTTGGGQNPLQIGEN